MPVCPTPIFGNEERPFVDREEFIEAFETAFKNIGKKDYSVLVYYGIGGIGKTSLRKELPKRLEEYNESYQNTDVIWASVDFSIESHRQMDKFLGILKNELNQKCGVKFHLFDIAHATYWRKVNPQIPLLRDGYSEDSIVTDLLDSFGGLVSINYSSIKKVVGKAPDRLKEWALKREKEIARLPDMEALDIEKMLPIFFAHDLADYLQKTSKSAVIFIDSYEALWEKKRGQGSFNSRDEGIRQLIANLPKSALWVICGREELRWTEVDRDWNNYLEQYKLEKLPEEDALDFLNRCGIKEKEIQRVIFEGSEGVPYYLELAVDTYNEIKKTGSPVPDNFARIRSEIFDRFMIYLSIPEQETLKVLSTPRFWNKDIFNALIEKFKTGYSLTSFSELNRFSFVQETEGKLLLHPLMRESLQVYQDQKLKKEAHSFMRTYYSDRLKIIDIRTITPEHELALTEAFYHAKESLETKDLLNWFIAVVDPFYRAAFWQLITPMYEEMLQVQEVKLGSEHRNVATTLSNLAELYRHQGKYEKALPFYQRSLDISEKMLGPQHPDVATTLNNLAILYHQLGEYEKALPLYHRSLESRETVLGPQHPSVATSQNNLASLYNQMGNYEQALPLYQRALQIRETVLGPQHPSVATTLNNLAGFYEDMGEFEKALPLYQRSLDISEKMLGPQHPSFATTLNNLAELHRQLGEFEKALPLYQRSLDISEKMLGPQHPDVAAALNNLAELHRQLEEYEKAFSLYQRALEIWEKVMGSQHPNVAITLSNLAELYRQLGEYEKALPLYQRSLDINEKALGPQHPDVAAAQNNLAELYRQLGEYEKALPLYQRSLQIREKVLGSQHPLVAITLNNLASLYQAIGNYEKALPLYQRSLQIREKVLGSQHTDVAISLNNLASLYQDMGEYKKALPLYQRSLQIREKVLGSQHPLVAITLNNLAELYRQLGEYEKALSLSQKSLDINEKVLGPLHPNVAVAQNNLAGFYESMGEYEKALIFFQRSLGINEKVLGPQHPNVALTLNNIAKLHENIGDYEKVLPLYARALEIVEKVLGPQHPNTVTIRNNMEQFIISMEKKEKY